MHFPNTKAVVVALGLAALAPNVSADTVTVPFKRLTGFSGFDKASTAVFVADLSKLGFTEIDKITLFDSNSGVGGSPGAFSGFDVDAIKLSTTPATTADEASKAAAIEHAFDFTPAGTSFTPGTQRPPAAPKLFGTDASGLNVNPDSATLNTFDAKWFVSGFVSLGDGGSIAFNLKSPVSTAGGLYAYVGEVSGSTGEAISGGLVVSSPVPEPSTWALMLGGLGILSGMLSLRRARRSTGA
ncbi:MAG: PEP-CTERM sorting domain-containing protein [Sterolibacteriaceae bacterium]|uniref:PEP-CTERM sorting domain-containing protein n=1 Tax=Candidatus Methylophosphatis roskildensis TaxID=2899263 RepID=A0A9D7HT34_9PROT|nr:PEP-CTERM sorting domain-containing protein [Candidatus Methylophosphatis roskildensis]MBK7235343.1 PEP-CTERM sorting domain-containing protein [Sterolibacteriaceae bacterium]